MNEIVQIETSEVRMFVRLHDDYEVKRSRIGVGGGKWVRECRKAKKLSLHACAELIGIDTTYLSKIENAHMPLTVEVARRFLQILTQQEEFVCDVCGKNPCGCLRSSDYFILSNPGAW